MKVQMQLFSKRLWSSSNYKESDSEEEMRDVVRFSLSCKNKRF